MSGSAAFFGLIFFFIIILIVFTILDKKIEIPSAPPEQYGRTSYTQTGYRVKSNAERLIADYFTRKNIRYEYESPVVSKTHRHISRPDFYLPDYNVYIEYWGLINIDDEWKKKEYEKNMRWKMAQYYNNDIKFISIYPDNLKNFDMIFRWKFEDVTGTKLPN